MQAIAASYLDVTRGAVLSEKKRRELFLFIMAASSKVMTKENLRQFQHLSLAEMHDIVQVMRNVVPPEPAPDNSLPGGDGGERQADG